MKDDGFKRRFLGNGENIPVYFGKILFCKFARSSRKESSQQIFSASKLVPSRLEVHYSARKFISFGDAGPMIAADQNYQHADKRNQDWQQTLRFLLAGIICAASSVGVWAQNNVTTQHNDIARTGANTNETILTPGNVNMTTFGKLFSQPVDGRIYTQPLYMPAITMGSGTPQAGTQHNVVYVATEHDSVYAFDADNNTGANVSPLWKITLLDAAHGAAAGATTVPNGNLSTSDIVPEIGITSTPVIDPSTNTIYVVGKTLEGSTYVQRLHALDIATGNEKFGGPVALAAQVAGTGTGSSGGILHWDPEWENNRTGLLLLNGIIYIGFGSHGDNGPWHGWILAYRANTLTQTGAWCASPNGNGDGIWMSGTGLAADVPDPINHPYGRIFTATGNGGYSAVAPNYTNTMNYGDSIIKLDLNNGIPTMTSGGVPVGDDFTPHDQASLNGADQDVASGGVVLLPDSVGGGGRQLVQTGKSGRVWVVNRENMGGYNPSNTKDPQEEAYINGVWGGPAYWNGTVYLWGSGDHLRAFPFANGVLASSPSSSSTVGTGSYSPTPSVSSNGTTNGIVWGIRSDANSALLYAFDATDLSIALYNSSQKSPRDATGGTVKFIVPTVINGKVYDGSASQLDVFGLLNGAVQAATPLISPASQTFIGSLQVTITDGSAGAIIYYTTDGSTPSVSSKVYSGPFTVTSTTTVKAVASGGGFLTSQSVSTTYTLQSQVVVPVFSPAPGSYNSGQLVTISTTTANSTIYYTTDGSTPATSSTKYTGPVFVGLSGTLSAIATSAGLSNSPVATGGYLIASSGTGADFANGFGQAASYMTFNGSTGLDDVRLQLTSGLANQAGSAWYNFPVGIKSFVNDFAFQISNAGGEGIAFVIQNAGLSAVGPNGAGLGYGAQSGGGTGGISNSVAIKFDEVSNAGEGSDSTGLYVNGASPTIPAVDLTSSGILVGSGDTISAHMVYDGTTLTMTLTDQVVNKTFTQSWIVDIPSAVGSGAAYIGFTGSTSSLTSSQKITSWTFSSTSAQPFAATPTFSLASGPYLGTQTVSITDTTAGASIFYTLDGSRPATSGGGSTIAYSGPITVTATETINTLATASGFNTSALASASYTIEAQVAAPVFSPGAGIYPSAQTVTISTTSPNATIYYTTNGATPTTSSTVYVAPIVVGISEKVQAIAVASGFFNSNVSAATYTINSGSGTAINLGGGFTAGSMILNGSATINGSRLRLTDGGGTEASSAWYTSAINIQQFTTNFTFQITGGTNPTADGFTFVIQGGPSTAIGAAGGALGYGAGGNPGIGNSIAVKFDLYSNSGEGIDSTGLYTNGAAPILPAIDMTSSGVNLHTTDVFNVAMSYDGVNLMMTVTDTTTNATFTNSWPINIPATVGGNSALIGFTGGTGGQTAIQEIVGWTLSSGTLPAATTPTFSPLGGTYTSAQNVTISDATSGAAIYYTTNGTTPTTGSALYSGPINVSSSQTIQAIAVANGFSNSGVGSAAYTINSSSGSVINLGSGFTPGSVVLNGSAILNGTRLRLTDATKTFQVGSAWYNSAVNIQQFTSNFSFQITGGSNPTADGFTFVIQGGTSTAIGPAGGGLGYGPAGTGGTPGIAKSVAVKFDLYSNAGEGINSTGLYTNGASPSIPALDMTSSGVNLHTTDVFNVSINYDGTNLTMTITDASTNKFFTNTWPVNIPSIVGGNSALVGFTAGTGGQTAIQDIIGWTLSSTAPSAAATPTFTPGPGTYTSVQSVTINDTTGGAKIYYTTNGTTPTTGSTLYAGPISVGSSQTIQAIAAASGFTNSAVGSATYTINLPAATPTFTPVAGTYSSAQSVTINDATSGAKIYYTTNGTTPTTGSTLYSGPINVAASETLQAIAAASGFSNSSVGSASYVISGGSGSLINYGSGFSASGLSLNGSSAINGTRLRLTNGGLNQAASAWYATPVNVQTFSTDFTFQLTNPTADGFAFVIQNAGSAALGQVGGGLGYAGIGTSVAVKFDLTNNAGEGSNSIGIYLNGASPAMPAITLGNGVNLHSGDTFAVHFNYDGTTLSMSLKDTVTSASLTYAWIVNIPATINSNTAYVGFTAGTGSSTATEDIVTWTYGNNFTATKAIINDQTSLLAASSSGPTFRTFAYVNFPDTTGTILDATKAGDSVTMTVNIPAAGSYDIRVNFKYFSTRGISQLSINGSNVGAAFDEYAGADTNGLFDFGTFAFPSAGNYPFKFTVTGKNAGSTGYSISFDDLTLSPQ